MSVTPTEEGDAPEVGAKGALQALADGARAQRHGDPVTACPFDPDGEWAERTRSRYWIKGWAEAKRGG